MIKMMFSFICTLLLFTCKHEKEVDLTLSGIDFKQEMRDFVIAISQYGKNLHPGFIVIPQNGQELMTQNGDPADAPVTDYLNAIDGTGREDLLYGYDDDNVATPAEEVSYMASFLEICKQEGIKVLVTDYCSDHAKMDDSYSRNALNGYISFAAPERELNRIPDYPSQPYTMNSDSIGSLDDARNFLYLINPDQFNSKQSFINAVAATNYDGIIMDLFFDDYTFTNAEIEMLKMKNNGGRRLVIAYLSIGEAEDYRYYWNNEWLNEKPAWLDIENPEWQGNYKVRYWNEEWQAFIYGNNSSYLKKILDAGFDGVYLDIIDAFEYYESLTE